MRRPGKLLLGEMVLDVLPDGRVLVTLPVREVPFGVAVQATAVYPSLRAFLTTACRSTSGHTRQ